MKLTLFSAAMLLAFAYPQPASQAQPKEKDFLPLFNGKNLDGWKQFAGQDGKWKTENGVIACIGRGGGWLGTIKEYDDFELRLEYRLKPGGNSGVYIRAPQKGHISRVGMEIQALDDAHVRYKNINNYQYTGAIYHVVGPKERATLPAPRWNALAIRADKRQVSVWVNGKKVVDANLDHYLQNPAVAKEHTGLRRKAGHIGLQSHTDRVEYRNIRIRELK